MDIFNNCEEKMIIVFGAGLMFEDYMKKNGDKHPPEFIVDNDKAKWGTKRQGITIKNPDDILKIPEEKRRVIICSVYYKQIEEQLKKMGITDYRIYVQEKNWIIENQ
jgi:prephenate dehydrogenase